MLARIRWTLTPGCVYSIYTAYIRPIVTSCGIVAVLAAALVERLQRRDAKIVSKMRDSDKAVGYLKWPSLVNRRDNHVNQLVNRGIKGQCPQFFKNYFTFNSSLHNCTTRQMNRLPWT